MKAATLKHPRADMAGNKAMGAGTVARAAATGMTTTSSLLTVPPSNGSTDAEPPQASRSELYVVDTMIAMYNSFRPFTVVRVPASPRPKDDVIVKTHMSDITPQSLVQLA